MMATIIEEKKQSLSIQNKIRKAAFVPIKSEKTKSFKYSIRFLVSHHASKTYAYSKAHVIKLIGKARLYSEKYDWVEARKELFWWLINSILEGISWNFATYILFGWPMNLWTVLAYGFIINQGLSIYWRTRKDGPSTTIPQK